MKKVTLFLTAFLGLSTAAFAESQSGANTNGSASERKQAQVDIAKYLKIKAAIQYLMSQGVVSEVDNQCLQVDQSLLDELRSNGTVKPSNGSTVQSICVVPM